MSTQEPVRDGACARERRLTGSGRVCVPIDPALIDEFDPEEVPTVGRLLRELNETADDGTETGHTKRSGEGWSH